MSDDRKADSPWADEAFRTLALEALPSGVVYLHADWSIKYANRAAQELAGLELDTATGNYIIRDPVDVLWEDGSKCESEDYPARKAIRTGESQAPTTLGLRRRDGRTLWVMSTAAPVRDESGSVAGAMVTFVDVTARREAQAARLTSEGRLHAVLESVPTMIISTDADGIIRYHNRSPDIAPDTVGSHYLDHVLPEDHDLVRRCCEEAMRTRSVMHYETRATNRRLYAVRVAPIMVSDRFTGLTFAAWDLSSRRELEARAAVADRLASLGTLAASVAHEVNNPLTYLLMNLGWIVRYAEAHPERAENLAVWARAAQEGAAHIRDIVRELDTFSRGSDAATSAVDVRRVLESSLRVATTEVDRRAKVIRDYQPVPTVQAAESRLSQVFLNLILNAAHAIPEGAAESNEIRLTTRTNDVGAAVIEVHDTGVGVPAEVRDKIFEPFFTTKPAGSGTGLGLYVCKTIVASLGGELTMETSRKGSTFRVVLPSKALLDPAA